MASLDLLKPDTLGENLMSINAVLIQSYNQAKKHLHDGITVIKDEFIGIYDKAESYFNIIAHPVNNFLKDLTQIDAEFRYELNKTDLTISPITETGNVVPIELALNCKMEENY